MKCTIPRMALLWIVLAAAASAAAAQDASLEFEVHVTPSGGVEEPVRGFPFYLLSKSFAEILKEADTEDPKPDMDAFIAKLEVSPELKAWMKKNETVSLSGGEFYQKLKIDDILKVPEFLDAYETRNTSVRAIDFPRPKYKPADKTKNPEKYEKLKAEYEGAIRRFYAEHPDSTDGMDIDLEPADSGKKWDAMMGDRGSDVHREALELAQSKYLVGRAETNLDGKGYLRGIPPGAYWLSTLDVAADVGDIRPRWDYALTLRPGEAKRIALSNANAVRTTHQKR